MHTLTYINSSQKIMLEGLSNDLRGQMSPKVVHSSPDLPRLSYGTGHSRAPLQWSSPHAISPLRRPPLSALCSLSLAA